MLTEEPCVAAPIGPEFPVVSLPPISPFWKVVVFVCFIVGQCGSSSAACKLKAFDYAPKHSNCTAGKHTKSKLGTGRISTRASWQHALDFLWTQNWEVPGLWKNSPWICEEDVQRQLCPVVRHDMNAGAHNVLEASLSCFCKCLVDATQENTARKWGYSQPYAHSWTLCIPLPSQQINVEWKQQVSSSKMPLAETPQCVVKAILSCRSRIHSLIRRSNAFYGNAQCKCATFILKTLHPTKFLFLKELNKAIRARYTKCSVAEWAPPFYN